MSLAASRDPWLRIQSPHFELFTLGSETSGVSLLQHFEQVRLFFLRGFGSGSRDLARPIRIFDFDNDGAFQHYSPNQIAFAFYQPGSDYDYIVMKSGAMEHYPVATYQFLHVLIHETGVPVPLWLNEGLAQVYATLSIETSRVVVGLSIPFFTDVVKRDWIDLRTLLSTGRDSPLYNETAPANLFYAESWGLTHMLNFDERYRKGLPALLLALQNQSPGNAFESVYAKPLDRIQDDLRGYMRQPGLRGLIYHVQLQKPDMVKIESHSGLQARLAEVDLLGAEPRRQPQVRAAYTTLAKDYPNRSEVELQWGLACWHSQDPDGARQHLARGAELGASGQPQMAEGILEIVECLGGLARLDVRIGGETRHLLVLDFRSLTTGGGSGNSATVNCGAQSRSVSVDYQPLLEGSVLSGVTRSIEFR